MTASGPWKAPSPGRRVSHLAPPGAAASTRPTAGRMVDHQEIQRGARSCFPGPAECGQNSPSRSGSKTGRLSNRASGGKMPPEARLFLSVAKCMAKRKSGNLNRPKLLYIAREKTAFQLKSGLFFGAAGRIRTADLILTKRPWNFFLTIFRALWPYPLQSACFPPLFDHKVSVCFTAVCGWLCGQSVGAVGSRDLTVCTNVVRVQFSAPPQ